MYIVQVQSPNQCWTGFFKARDKYPSVINTSYLNTYSSIFKTFKELLLGILTSLVLRKYDFLRVFEITGTGVSLILWNTPTQLPPRIVFLKSKDQQRSSGSFMKPKFLWRFFEIPRIGSYLKNQRPTQHSSKHTNLTILLLPLEMP